MKKIVFMLVLGFSGMVFAVDECIDNNNQQLDHHMVQNDNDNKDCGKVRIDQVRYKIELFAAISGSLGFTLYALHKAGEDTPAGMPWFILSLFPSCYFVIKLLQERDRIGQLSEKEKEVEHKCFTNYIVALPEN